MNKKASVFIHLGYPKCASTSIQNHLFNKHPDINYLGLYTTEDYGVFSGEIDANNTYLNNSDLRKFYSLILHNDDIEYVKYNISDFYQQRIKHLLNKRINVFSHESFLSTYSCSRAEKAKRLKKLFPEAKIIFIIRRQADLLRSHYDDNPFDPSCRSSGKHLKIKKWIQYCFNLEYSHNSLLKSFDFYANIKYYEQLFGKENIGVFLFEDFVQNKIAFAQKLAEFMAIEKDAAMEILKNAYENKTISKRYKKYRILCRRLGFNTVKKILPESNYNQFIKFLKKGKAGKTQIPETDKKRITDYFSSSNKELDKEYLLHLKEYNYY